MQTARKLRRMRPRPAKQTEKKENLKAIRLVYKIMYKPGLHMCRPGLLVLKAMNGRENNAQICQTAVIMTCFFKKV